jgi:alpha,alpha-trehalase
MEYEDRGTILNRAFKEFKKEIIRPPKGVFKYEYLVPGGVYDQLWDWDSFFIGVALTYTDKVDSLKNSVQNFLEISDEEGHAPWYATTTNRGLSKPHQCKPFLAQGSLIASRNLHDFGWIFHWYDKLKKVISFWGKNRLSANGLFKWWDGWESGADNNPGVIEFPENTVEGVDINVYLAREFKAMSIIAEKLGFSRDSAIHKEKAEGLTTLIGKRMWDEEDKSYYNIDSKGKEFIRVKTWTNFTPLWEDIPSKKNAEALIKNHLLNPDEFWSPFGVRSLSKDEPLYNQAKSLGPSNWQGPIWIVANWMMMHGLLNYGFKEKAIELAEKIQNLLAQDLKRTGGMHECYNAETGEPLAAPNFVSWNLLAEHMLYEAKSGINPAKMA